MSSRIFGRRRGFGFPGLLIVAGVVLLLVTIDVLPNGYFAALWPFWPLLIVALGLNVLLSRIDARIGSTLALVVVVGALVAAWPLSGSEASAGDRTIEDFTVEIGNAESARVELTLGATHLELRSGADPDVIATGSLSSCRDGALRLDVDDRAGVRTVRLSTNRGAWDWFSCGGFGDTSADLWSLALNPELPMVLQIDIGASESDIDLTDLNISRLEINTGASDTHVRLPRAAGRTSATFNIGAANLEIEIPVGVAARIDVEAGLASLSIDQSRFPSRGGDGISGIAIQGIYESPDFDSAENRVDIKIQGGASSISVT